MPALLDFDRFCLAFPPLTRESDFDRFWNDALAAGRKVAIDPETKPSAKAAGKFDVSDVSFSGVGKVRIHAALHMPKGKERPHPIVVIHDYNSIDPYRGFPLDEKFAYLFVRLRGHESFTHHAAHAKPQTPKQGTRAAASKEPSLPGYFAEGISAASTYYVKGVYCDALRSIDLLRLNRKIDCSEIGIIGKGIGAAAAVFCASHSDRVTAMVLDSPAFVNLEDWLNESESDISSEIESYLHSRGPNRAAVKRTLSYFDAINFTEDVSCDTLMSIGLRDEKSPAKCSFALFNRLRCDKTVEVYPDDGNEAGGEKQWKKSLAWMRKRLS